MRVQTNTLVAGVAVGFLESFGIWFVPEEPHASFVVAAGTLKGLLTAVLIAGFVDRRSSVKWALGIGALIGFSMSTIVFLAKGGWMTWDAPFVVPSGVISGLFLGALLRWLNRSQVA